MSKINIEIGRRIRTFRKKRGMTLEDLSAVICKGKSTISKYENGEISVDIETMYDIADALRIHVEQLLYHPLCRADTGSRENCPAFFEGISRFYAYIFDGRSNELIRCVLDLLPDTDDQSCKVMMYMNFKDYEYYQRCENMYWGYMEHYDAITNIQLKNQDMPMERASVQILAAYLDLETKWGLFNGFSSRPMMPIAAKMLFSKERLRENEELYHKLKVSKEDIRILKHYNMFAVT